MSPHPPSWRMAEKKNSQRNDPEQPSKFGQYRGLREEGPRSGPEGPRSVPLGPHSAPALAGAHSCSSAGSAVSICKIYRASKRYRLSKLADLKKFSTTAKFLTCLYLLKVYFLSFPSPLIVNNVPIAYVWIICRLVLVLQNILAAELNEYLLSAVQDAMDKVLRLLDRVFTVQDVEDSC